jgi:dihydroxyacetone kinase-like protein
MLKGVAAARPDLVVPTRNPRVMKAPWAPVAGKVGIVMGGGAGHEPPSVGYIGRNMLDAVAVGEVFTSPSAQAFADAFRAADGGAGVACLFGNYAGDVMNVKLARRIVEGEGIPVETVIANDDVASAPPDQAERRRGLAGEILMWKVGGATAAQGGDLGTVIAAAQKAVNSTRSVGVGLTPCTIPAVGHPNFEIRPGTMELGIGHHGEPGVRTIELLPARDIARVTLDLILPDLPFSAKDEVAVLVSGLGATPLMEQYILYGHIADRLAEANIRVWRVYVGNLFTSLDMMGVTVTVMRLDDDLKACLALPIETIGLTQVAG